MIVPETALEVVASHTVALLRRDGAAALPRREARVSLRYPWPSDGVSFTPGLSTPPPKCPANS